MMFAEKKKGLPICNEFLRRKVIFIHIPKCAGSSISLNWLGFQVGHQSYRQYEVKLGGQMKDFFIFSFVRHPETRFVSAYQFLSRGGMSRSDKKFLELNRKYFQRNPNELLFALKNKLVSWYHFDSMCSFIKSKQEDILLNKIFKIEDEPDSVESVLSECVDSEFARLIVDTLKTTAIRNATPYRTNEKYDDLDLDLLEDVYSEDYWRLGYDRKT